MARRPADRRPASERAAQAEPATPELGTVLRRARLHQGLTLRDVEGRTQIPNAHLSQIELGRIRRPDPAIVFELAQVYGLNYALVAEWAGYVDARLPVDADLLDFVVRTFVSLDAGEQEKALVYLKGLRDQQAHGIRGPD